MASILPPTVHSYQRPTGTNRTLQKPETTIDSTLSPNAALHKAIREKKEQANVVSVPSPTVAVAHVPSVVSGSSAACAVHSVPRHITMPHAHPMARPAYCAVSSTCCLPRASFWNLRCSCIFSALPDELLLFNVFSFFTVPELSSLAPVCSRWKFLSTDPLLHREVDLSKHSKVVGDEVFESVMSRVGDHVTQLKLCNLKLLSPEALQRLGDAHLTGNSSLNSLHFCSIKSIDASVLSRVLVGSVVSSLRELSLFGCVNVDDACVRLIRRSCVRLADLSVRGCIKLTDAAFVEEEEEHPVVEEELDDPLLKKQSEMEIEVLDEVESASIFPEEERSRSVSSTSTRSLSSYSSSASSTSSSSSEAKIVGRFAYLTNLNVANCKLLTEAGLIAIFRASPLLQKLNLHGVNPTDTMMDILTSYCPQLHTLHLSSANPFGGNLQLTDVGVEYIAARLPQMQCLNLQGSSKLTDGCIAPLIQHCRQLEKLNLGGCFKLTHASVVAICQSESPSQLTHLSLFQCLNITDASVRLLADSLPLLQHLDIHSCASLTDATIEYLLEIMQQASEIPPPLESLDEEVPAASFPLSGAFRLPQLQSLDIGSCRKITKEAVASMNQTRPQITVTHY